MAKIVISGTIVQYPLGGMTQWVLAWIIGLKRLGHNVFFVEKATWEDSCYDLERKIMSNNCNYGLSFLKSIFKQHELLNNWCFVDYYNTYYGLSEMQIKKKFNSSDIFIDLEWGTWEVESKKIPIRVFFDGEPGWFQIKLEKSKVKSMDFPVYDFYFTHGLNLGEADCIVPNVGIQWRPTFAPVLINGLKEEKINSDSQFTTVMNWKSHKKIEYKGKIFGQKDIEFEKFIQLPKMIGEKLVVAVSGPNVPRNYLKENGWSVLNADNIASSVKNYNDFINRSKGEFSVMKNVFVDNNTGAFSDRAGYYMQYGRPVVCQETGFSKHIPCGKGLFAVNNMEEAAIAMDAINSNYKKHAIWAREIAHEYFDACKVLKKLLNNVGL